MSKVDFRNTDERAVTHLATGRRGDLRLADRVVTRGRGVRQTAATTFVAIFTFDDPLVCALSDVPENGGYYLDDDGMAEVTQLTGRFASDDEREVWLKAQFGTGR